MIPRPPMPFAPPPDRTAVLAELRAFVANWFRDGRDDGLLPDTPLVTSGIVDSAGVIEVVEFVERRFGARFEDADLSLANCNTLSALADLVVQRR